MSDTQCGRMQVLQLRGRFQEAMAKCLKDPDGETDEVDTAKGIARLWVEIGEAYSSLIATGRRPCPTTSQAACWVGRSGSAQHLNVHGSGEMLQSRTQLALQERSSPPSAESAWWKVAKLNLHFVALRTGMGEPCSHIIQTAPTQPCVHAI